MDFTYTKKVTEQARFLKLDVAVRYDEEDMPNDAPLRDGDSWRATIDLDEKRIVDWPTGETLSFTDMKICDEGRYELLNGEMISLAIRNDYVPNQLLPGAYGDYLSLTIDENGYITNWLKSANLDDFNTDEEN